MSHENGIEDSRVTAARLRLSLARQNTCASMTILRQELPEQIRWQTWYRVSPELFLTAAFLIGFILAKRR